MNLPDDPNKHDVPPAAKGNPVYEQTHEDMPLWCCGRNCGRNSRVVVLVLTLIAIGCSTWVCLSHKYFQFVSFRNDTFFDEDKAQPEPFEYATKANVGIFRYEILEVYEYPWPLPKQERQLARQERQLAEEMLLAEVQRLLQDSPAPSETPPLDAALDATTASPSDGNATASPTTDLNNATLALNATASPTGNATDLPTVSPDTNATEIPVTNETESPTSAQTSETSVPFVPDVGPGSTELFSASPTTSPTAAPTETDPNEIVAASVDIGEVKKYPLRMDQFDSLFRNAQLGAMVAPILAGIGTIFGLVELCCCTYKCSWLPTAMFIYLAFMLQMMTLFLFLSEDFCKYAQECSLGIAGWLSVVAVLFYMIANTLVCCTPRPPPCFKCCKKPPVRRKKKKKKKKGDSDDDMEREGLNPNDPDYGDDEFMDEDENGYVDPYNEDDDDDEMDDDEYDYEDDSYIDPDTGHKSLGTVDDDDVYNEDPSYADYDNDTYADDTFAGDDTYGADNSYYDDQDDYTEDGTQQSSKGGRYT
jgi:hypothetical protein